MTPPHELRELPCLACGVTGREGREVMFKLVEIPEEERRVVTVVLPEFAAQDSLQMPVEVRERYVTEPRCRDEAACRRRVLDHLATMRPPALPATSEAVATPAPADGGSSAASLVPGAPPAATSDPVELDEHPAEPPEEYVL